METTEKVQGNLAEMVTISRAEYERFQAQSKRISELESRVDMLMEALRLARHKRFGASSEKSEELFNGELVVIRCDIYGKHPQNAMFPAETQIFG